MSDDLNSVKSQRSYHHGALRPALIAAARTVLAERGTEGFSLRETARRAGVSPAAPAHHFSDASGLLTAVAAGAFSDLGDALEAAAGAAGSQDERIRAQGIAYVRFALADRARFDLMWRAAMLKRNDPEYSAAAKRAFKLLQGAVGDSGSAADSPRGPGTAAAIACWSVVHGFARLAIDGEFGTRPGDAEAAAEHMLPLVLDHLDV